MNRKELRKIEESVVRARNPSTDNSDKRGKGVAGTNVFIPNRNIADGFSRLPISGKDITIMADFQRQKSHGNHIAQPFAVASQTNKIGDEVWTNPAYNNYTCCGAYEPIVECICVTFNFSVRLFTVVNSATTHIGSSPSDIPDRSSAPIRPAAAGTKGRRCQTLLLVASMLLFHNRSSAPIRPTAADTKGRFCASYNQL